MIVEEEDYLEHFGVKGMKWGVRKNRTTFAGEGESRPGMSTKKKILIGAGVVAAGAAIAAAVLVSRGKVPMKSLPQIRESAFGGRLSPYYAVRNKPISQLPKSTKLSPEQAARFKDVHKKIVNGQTPESLGIWKPGALKPRGT